MEVDVAVIGGSSAGFYAAELLARQGRQVAVFERRKSLSYARRTLIVTPRFEHLTGTLPPAVRIAETSVIRLVCGMTNVDLPLPEPDLVVERSAFVQWMHDRALSAGAEVLWSSALTGLSLANGAVKLTFSKAKGVRQVRVREAIIGADGFGSAVAAMTGLSRPRTVTVLQAEVQLPEGHHAGMTQVWFDANETRFFYWLIPELPGRAVAGVIGETKDDPQILLRRFLLKLGLSPLGYQGARVAMHHPGLAPWTRIGGTRVFLVGDAAGQVKVTTVGGTVTGLLGAEAAVRAICEDLPPAFTAKSLKRELDLHWMLRKCLNRLDNPGYELLLSSLTSRVRSFLANHNRDSMAAVFWRLPLLNPALLLVALRGLRAARPVSAQGDCGQRAGPIGFSTD